MSNHLYDATLGPPHPGEILRDDLLPLMGLSRTKLAEHLGISRRKLADLLAERCPVTLDLALRLGAALGQGARYWLGLQAQYDIWQAEQPGHIHVKRVQWPHGCRIAA